MALTIIKSDPRAREKPCIRCGYSLRKITDSNNCPECGLSVWLSLNQNDTLEMGNPQWLRRMAQGLWVLALASVLAVSAFAPVTLQAFRHMQYRQRLNEAIREAEQAGPSDDDATKKWVNRFLLITRPKPDHYMQLISLLLGGVGIFAYQLGLLILTSNENRYPDRLAGLRIAARIICGVAGLSIILMFTQMLGPTPLGFPEWMTRLVAISAGMLTWNYLQRLARRMPDKGLARVCGLMMFTPLLSLFYSFIRSSDWLPDVIPLIYLPAAAGLFVWFAILLRRAAREADCHWGTETADTR
jgi:hypothetical protein